MNHSYPLLEDRESPTLQSFRTRVKDLDKRQWTVATLDHNQPRHYLPKAPDLSIVVQSKSVPNLFWLDRYLSMKVEGVSVLAYASNWINALSLKSTSNVKDLRKDLL